MKGFHLGTIHKRRRLIFRDFFLALTLPQKSLDFIEYPAFQNWDFLKEM